MVLVAAVILAVISTFCAAAAASTSQRLRTTSYLLGNRTSEGSKDMQRLLDLLHAQQHPPKEQCGSRRLLIVQFINSFEGLGSILKLVTLGLAEAAHSNRTLIFGLHPLPHMFEKSRDEWFNKKTATGKRKVTIKDVDFDCAYQDGGYGYDGSGPYACFFEPLSTCTFNDVSFDEMLELGRNGYDDAGRVKIQEERRAPAAYQYPVHNPLYTDAATFPAPPANLRHKWVGALAAYVFRLKADVVALLERRRLAMWPRHLGGKGYDSNCYQFCPDQYEGVDGDNVGEPVWGLHVRHGDMKAYEEIYQNRKLYPFVDYMAMARRRARRAATAGAYHTLPAAVYVSSDSVETPEFIRDTCASPHMWEWLVTEDDAHDLFYDPPCVFSTDDRFRTEHGSHTVAGAGACAHTYKQGDHTMTCALKVEDLAMYRQTNDDVRHLSLAKRLMRALFEALEDMYLLSLMDFFVGTLSSHYSTHVAMLVWARNGAVDPANEVAFLDLEEVESGFHECSYFLFILRPLLQPWEGRLRWIHHTRRFLEGLTNFNTHTGVNHTVAEEPSYRIRLVDQLPWVPLEVFSKETARWLGSQKPLLTTDAPSPASDRSKRKGKRGAEAAAHDGAYPSLQGVWPGECSVDPSAGLRMAADIKSGEITSEGALMEVATLLNFGADHHEIHHNQAVRCWRQAERLLLTLQKAVIRDKTVQATVADYLSVARGNLAALANLRMAPFSQGEREIKRHLKENFGRKVGYF